MCLNPVSVPNPHFLKGSYASEFGKIVELGRHFSSAKEYITVPCGKCVECRDTYFNSLLQRALCEARSSYLYFVTLTYDDKHIPYVDLDDNRILYADYSDFQLMIKRLRNQKILDRDFRYLCVNEYGDIYSRPHMHAIFFVAKKTTDNEQTPFVIEKLLYDNIGPNFARNVGTRKNPVYEPLFTFCQRVTPFGIRSNYWVQLIESDAPDYLKDDDDSSFIRTIRYLIGYVNTHQRFDDTISEFLSRHSYDTVLCDKIKRVLSNKVRFSKGFGCGFVDGEKFYLPKISVRASSNVLVYSEIVSNLPKTFDELEVSYPQLADYILDWISIDKYRKFDSLDACVKSFTIDDYILHSLAVRYFPKTLSNHLNVLYKKPYNPTISSFFTQCKDYRYKIKCVTTSKDVCNSDLYKFLRQGVEDGLSHRVPFITFTMKSQQGYISLCKYYRERICIFDDFQRMLDNCGFNNYDEWIESFLHSYNTRKRDKSLGNFSKYAENKEICFVKQKKSLSLRQRSFIDVYTSIVL